MGSRRTSGWWVACGVLVVLLCCCCVLIPLTISAGLVTSSLSFLQQSFFEPLTPILESVPTVPSPMVAPTREATPLPAQPLDPEAEASLARLHETIVPIADPLDLAKRLRGIPNPPRVIADSAPPIPLGTIETFWAYDKDTDEQFQADLEMLYATDHVYFWAEQGLDLNLRDVARLVDEFEYKIYPTNREFFGSEWTPGVDGDPHLYIAYMGGLGDRIAGYFGSNDSLPPIVHRYSNGHEMFFINADNALLDEAYTISSLAHEFQHMIHANLDRNEESWVNEGFAELASFLNGYDTGGWDYAFAGDMDLPLTFWPPDVAGEHYGQAFLVMTYFLDRFGEEATKALVATAANGLDAIDEVLAHIGAFDPASGQPMVAEDVLQDWAVAMLLQDRRVGDGRYAYASYPSAPEASVNQVVWECPAMTTSETVQQYGVDYIEIDCRGDFTLSFDGQQYSRVVPADPYTGDFAFWSNRGDESDMTLTRAFDLRDVSGPVSLDYKLWHEIEDGWDFAYLMASADGGVSWEILKTPSGTDKDPFGNSFGWGYTGTSGGGMSGEWLEESVDLSAYAGEEVLLRFEYITDAAVNGEGLMLDDVRLAAAGYSEDFEAGDGGWDAAGFVRLYNRLPQTYRLMLVEFGDPIRVTPIPLDSDQRAQVDLALDDDVERAVLMVMGATRHTWQPATYQYSIE
jgi:immune inhibitor A